MANILSKSPPPFQQDKPEESMASMCAYLYYLYEAVDFFLGQTQKSLDESNGVNGRMASTVATLAARVEDLERRVAALGN